MSNLRPPRKLLAIAASSAAATAILAGCASQEILGQCGTDGCGGMGDVRHAVDGGDAGDAGDGSAPDASDATTDAPIKVDAGVVATPLDGGDGG